MEQNDPAKATLKPGIYRGSPATPGSEASLPAVRAIRTMKSDIAEVISEQKETAASIALAEERKLEWARASTLAAKQEEATQTLSAQPIAKPRGRFWVIFIFLALLLIAGAITYKFFAPTPQIINIPLIGDVNFGKTVPQVTLVTTPVAPTPKYALAIIAPQDEKRFVLSNETPEHTAAAIAVERTAGLTRGVVKNLYFSELQTAQNFSDGSLSISVGRLFSFMRAPAPEYVLRATNPTFMFGLLGEQGSIATPFLILKTSDTDAARASLLSWEPSMLHDIGQLFGTKIEYAGTPTFADSVVAGFDARILNSLPGATIAYVFVDKNTIVIAGTQSALVDLLSRLAKK